MKLKQVHIGGFGGLSDCKKEFESGLNVIYGENGAGKSSFLAFLKTCLYGFETKGREKYFPWNGTAPHGSMIFEQDGEWLYQVTFGKTKKGDKITFCNNLTGEERAKPESLGRELFSMGGETFSKTACVTQGQLMIKKDDKDEIAEKLANLEQTGESQVSYGACVKTLTTMLSKLRNRRGDGGLLNQAEQKVLEFREQEQMMQEKIAQGAQNYRRIQEIEQEMESLGKMERQWESFEKSEQKRLCQEYQEKLDRLFQLSEGTDEEYERYEVTARKWEQEEETLRLLKEQETEIVKPEPVLCTQEEFSRVMAGKKRPLGLLTTSIILAVVFTLCGVLVTPWCYIPSVFSVVGAVFFAIRKTEPPWEAYGCRSSEEFSQKYSQSLEQQSAYDGAMKQQKKRQEQMEVLVKNIEKYKEEGKQLNCLSPGELFSLCSQRRNRQAERKSALAQIKTYEELLTNVLAGKTMEEVCEAEETERPALTKEELHQKQLELARETEQLEAKQQHLYEEAPETLTACRLEWEQKRDEYHKKEQVLQVTLEVLEQAYLQMEQQFGSSLNQRAGELLEQMTQGKYSQVRISKDFSVKLTEDSQTHSLEQFSGGVFDQTYLAFRLAMLELMETEAPLFLDDVLMQYDDARAKETMIALEEYALRTDTQILLFTCRNRDFDLAKQRKNINCIEII